MNKMDQNMDQRDRAEFEEDDADQGEMTVQEAGRKGGEATANRHGPQFYEEIGRKGGQNHNAESEEDMLRVEEMDRGEEEED